MDLFFAVISFEGDSSVGIFPYGYKMELPDFRQAFRPEEVAIASAERETVRKHIQTFYELLDGEFRANVFFSDELNGDKSDYVEEEKQPVLMA